MANRIAERLGDWATADDAAAGKRAARRCSARSRPTRAAPPRPPALRPRARRAGRPAASRPSTPSASRCCGASRWRPASPRTSQLDGRARRRRAAGRGPRRRSSAEAGAAGGPLADGAGRRSPRHLRRERLRRADDELASEARRGFGRCWRRMAGSRRRGRCCAGALGLDPDETPASIGRGGLRATAPFDVAGAAPRRGGACPRLDTDSQGARGTIAAWLEADAPTRAETFDALGRRLPDRMTKQPHVKDADTSRPRLSSSGTGTLDGDADRGRAAAVPAAAAARRHHRRGDRGAAGGRRGPAAPPTARLKQSRALLDYDDLIERGAAAAASTATAPLGALQARRRHRPHPDRRGAGHRARAVAGDRARADRGVLRRRRAPARRRARSSRSATSSSRSSASRAPIRRPSSRAASASREQVRAAGGDWRPIELKTSFRSTRAVLDAVDAIFAAGGDDAQRSRSSPARSSTRRGGSGTAAASSCGRRWCRAEPAKPPPGTPPVDADRGRFAAAPARPADRPAHRNDAGARASRWSPKGRPIRAGDIMVLVRRRTAASSRRWSGR